MRIVTLTEDEVADLRDHFRDTSCAAGVLTAVTAKIDAAPAYCSTCLADYRHNANPEDAHHMSVEECNAGLPDREFCRDPGYHHPFKP